ncbi:X-linked retinitis pigmentosa GTPase regulator-interacting protein 1 [Podochytrium sp. JEL0797]|nr:X-linked retinitis pigmentosa GTPase regulator-interacting protein 1 [Podochytrium sp. JEL0797]
MNFFCKNGEIDISEIEEALSIVRLRRERGISLDFLMEAEELYADKELLQELRVQYADCIHELEKVRKLLYLQEHINKDYKLECEELNQKMEALRNGYELRLEEDSRLLDLRSNKISLLEGQLKSIVYGTAKIPGEIEKPKEEDDDLIELATGQNLIEIHIESALISDDGMYHIKKLGIDMEDPAKLTTFIHYDFFEFETQVSPMGLGQKPVFNYTAKYKVYTDDFFLQYLQSKHTVLNFAVSNGLEFFNVATCSVVMKELTDPDRTERLRYYADLISTHDNRTILGKIDFGLRVRLPMAQAIRSFKERTVALNLLTVSDKEVSSRRFRPRADTNDLVIRIINCTHLRHPPGRVPAVFASFQFYIHETMVTDTIRKSTSPMINFLRILPLPMTADLDRYLRTASLHIMILDDNDGIEDFEYGSVSVPLLSLALGEKIYDEYVLTDGYGNGKSKITVSLEWSKPYKLNVVPLISLLDEQIASTNGRSNKAVHSQDGGEEDDDMESKSRDASSKPDTESEMDKFESKRKQYSRRALSDVTQSTADESRSKQTSSSELTSTVDEGRGSVATSASMDTETKKPTPSEASVMSTIDEDDAKPSPNEEPKKSSEKIASRKPSPHHSIEDVEKSSAGEEKSKSRHDLKKSSEELGSRKTSHNSLALENENEPERSESRKLSHKSLNDLSKSSDKVLSRKPSPHRSLNELNPTNDEQKSEPNLKKSKEVLGSSKLSQKSLRTDQDERLESRKSSRKSLKDDKDEAKLDSRKSSHKSLAKEETEEKLASRKSSYKSLKDEEGEKRSRKSSSKSLKDEKESKESLKGERKSKEDIGSQKSSHRSLVEAKQSKEGLSSHKSSLKSLASIKKSKESLSKTSAHSKHESSSSNSDTESGSKKDSQKSGSEEESSEIKKSSKSSNSRKSGQQSGSDDEESSEMKKSSGTSKSKSSKSKNDTSAETTHSLSSSKASSESENSDEGSDGSESGKSDASGSTVKAKRASKESLKRTSSDAETTSSKSSNNSEEAFESSSDPSASSDSLVSKSTVSLDTVKASSHHAKQELGSSNSLQSSTSGVSKNSSILTDAERDLFRSSQESITSGSNRTSDASRAESGSSESKRHSTTTEEEETTEESRRLTKSSESLTKSSESLDTSNDSEDLNPPRNATSLTIRIEQVFFKMQSPKTQKLLRDVFQFFVSFDFLGCPSEELETHSVERDIDSGAHTISFSKVFALHPFKNERSRYNLTKLLNSRHPRDSTLLFTIVSEPTEDSSPDAECQDIAYAKLDLLELAEFGRDAREGKDGVRRELQIWDSNGDILMGTLVVFVKGVSVLAECLE